VPSADAIQASTSSSGEPRRYRIGSGDTLATIASRHGSSIDQLKRWNNLESSRIRAGETLIVGYGLPARQQDAVAVVPAAPQQAPAARPSGGAKYRIRSGDTLGDIAERFGVTAADLREWNHLRGSKIVAGNMLAVRPPAAPPAGVTQSAAPEPKPVTASAPTPSAGAAYIVRSGDTLAAIAAKHGVTVASLKSWNGLRSSRLGIGQRLSLGPPSASNGRYQIRPGDTLAVIARRFDVSVDDLKSWNGLSSSSIRAGSYLRVSRTQPGGD
jgi:membrane-bound lytic murein transglycosylase D